MIDLSQLSDEELLRYTKDLADDDEVELICEQCGARFTVLKHHRKFCNDCAAQRQAQKSSILRENKHTRIKTGSLGERWHLEYEL